jgi:SAM-dependent methyltransferase
MIKSLPETLPKTLAHSDIVPQPIHWTPELVERFWNGFSQTRLVEYAFSRQAGRSLIVAVDHLLSPAQTILDFGAGDGDLIRLLCERGLHAAAYEPSQERAHKLQQQLLGCTGFLGVVGAESDDTFDLIIMAEVIEHVLDEQLESCLTRINSLLKPDGKVIITTPNNEDLALGMVYCPVSNTLFHRWQHVRSFTDRSLVDLLSRHGFVEVVTHRLEFNNALYVPYDRIWGSIPKQKQIPSHILELRANRPMRNGSEVNLLYIGKKVT